MTRVLYLLIGLSSSCIYAMELSTQSLSVSELSVPFEQLPSGLHISYVLDSSLSVPGIATIGHSLRSGQRLCFLYHNEWAITPIAACVIEANIFDQYNDNTEVDLRYSGKVIRVTKNNLIPLFSLDAFQKGLHFLRYLTCGGNDL